MTVDTTAPRASRGRNATPESRPLLGFVVLASRKERHRVGEVALLRPFITTFFGRARPGAKHLIPFAKQRPGVARPLETGTGGLAGDSLSREELELYATGDDIEMKAVGRWPVLVNGKVVTFARLVAGDTVCFDGEVLLLVVLRHATLPALRAVKHVHPFGEPDLDGYVGESPAAWAWRENVAIVAEMNHHLLLLGQTGSGKELTAAAIHRLSGRKGELVTFNSSNVAPSLVDVELFGHAQNYPNPGMPARPGIFGSSDRGTLFLDEIGDMALEVQTRLLRALDNGDWRVAGEAKSRHADVRAVAATHIKLDKLREDFRNRFGGTVHVPSLGERLEDIPLLMRNFLRRRIKDTKTPRTELRFFRKGPTGELEPQVSELLVEYVVRNPPSGNVRQLGSILLQAITESSGDVIELPASLAKTMSLETPVVETSAVETPSTSAPPSAPEAEPEPRSPNDTADPMSASPMTDEGERRSAAGPHAREELVAMLEKDEWNYARLARRLGVHRNTLMRWLKAHGIERVEG